MDRMSLIMEGRCLSPLAYKVRGLGKQGREQSYNVLCIAWLLGDKHRKLVGKRLETALPCTFQSFGTRKSVGLSDIQGGDEGQHSYGPGSSLPKAQFMRSLYMKILRF